MDILTLFSLAIMSNACNNNNNDDINNANGWSLVNLTQPYDLQVPMTQLPIHNPCFLPFPLRRRPRGKRGGRRKQREIERVIPHRPTPVFRFSIGSDKNNLISINTSGTPSLYDNAPTPSHTSCVRKERHISPQLGHRPLSDQNTTRRPSAITNMSSKDNYTTVSNSEPFDTTTHKCGTHILRIGYTNAQSCRNKTMEIYDLIEDQDFDILFITESWLRNDGDDYIKTSLKPPGYDLRSFPRQNQLGGGIAVIFKDKLSSLLHFSTPQTSTFESIKVSLHFENKTSYFICVYRPPPNKKNGFKTNNFIDEFDEFLLSDIKNDADVMLLGDFNLHFDNSQCPHVTNMAHIFDTHNMTQHISSPTQKKGHILDWVITSKSFPFHQPIENMRKVISDHTVLKIEMKFKTNKPSHQFINSRDIKSIDFDAMKVELSKIDHACNNFSTEATLTSYRKILDSHAPVKMRKKVERKSSPWFNNEIHEAKRQRRRAERRWRKSDLHITKEIYIALKNKVKLLSEAAKRSYFITKFKNVKNSRDFFKFSNQLLGKDNPQTLPNTIQKELLPNSFGQFFKNKIDKIRDRFDDNSELLFKPFSGNVLLEFVNTSNEEVKHLILSSSTKSCDLDTIPTNILKQCLDQMLPSIVRIINDSLTTGTVPDSFKVALVRPLLKKPNLDTNVLNNFRPVSNLSFISKILEKVVLKHILKHLELNGLQEVFQSAYKANHSTETALVRVMNDLLGTIDNGSVSVLNLLDLSAAFDTIDHEILLKRLETTFGISGTVLKWIQSYLCNRKQIILINNVKSDEFELECGVPQGSVLGPVLFLLYVSPLSNICKDHNLSYHQYADDTQLYSTSPIPPNSFPHSLISHSGNCIMEIKNWMNKNRLKLNEEKTEVMLVGNSRKIKMFDKSDFHMTLGNNSIKIVDNVKNLGTIFDTSLSMHLQIDYIRKGLIIELKKIASLRPFLSIEMSKTLVISLLFSKLDYCNSLLFGLPNYHIQRLQRIQNHAARLVLRKRKSDNASPLLTKLHWLNVENRIKYKAAVLVYRCLENSAPVYLSELIHKHRQSRTLRSSSDSNRLSIPITKTRMGERAFSYFGPSTWNALPLNIRQSSSLEVFKKNLKTHYFKIQM